jgi:flagella basal body P-ring formation protein FlgA
VLAGVDRKEQDSVTRQNSGPAEDARFLPVIRAGDRLTVEEHTAVVDAVLEARALAAAAMGAALDVRLTIGGRVVRAVALGPGRAALQSENGVR